MTDILDMANVTGDPLDDMTVVAPDQMLFVSFEPAIIGTLNIRKHATFHGTMKKTKHSTGHLPSHGKIVVKGTTHIATYEVSAFDISHETTNRFKISPSTIESIEWTKVHSDADSPHAPVSVFRPRNPNDKALLLNDLCCWCYIDSSDKSIQRWEPHRPYCRSWNTTKNDIMLDGTITMNGGTFRTSSTIGVNVERGSLTTTYFRVSASVSNTGVLTWNASSHNVKVAKFECVKTAAMMADMILYYMRPNSSTADFNIQRPTPHEMLRNPEWQAVLDHPNVALALDINQVTTTKTATRRLEFIIRMNMIHIVNKLVVNGAGSHVSVHGPCVQRTNTLIGYVPSGAMRTRALAMMVANWEMFFAAYTRAMGTSDTLSLTRVDHPNDLKGYRQSALGEMLVIQTTGDWNTPMCELARMAFITDSCMDEGRLSVFMNNQYVTIDPRVQQTFLLGSDGPPAKKRLCAGVSA